MSLKPADVRHIDAIVREFRRFRGGEGLTPVSVVPCSVGAAMYHRDERGDAWAASLVRQPGSVASPIVAGRVDVVRETVDALLPALDRGERGVCEPPVARVRGLPRMFVAVGGRHLVGLLEVDERIVALLGAGGGAFFVLIHDGARTEVVGVGAPAELRELDLDPALVRLKPSDGERERPSRTALVRAGLRRLKEECQALEQPVKRARRDPRATPAGGPKRRTATRGRRAVDVLVEAILTAGLTGVGDLIGTTSEIHRWLCVLVPGFGLSLRSLADALRLLRSAASSFVTRPSPHRWHIHLRELVDPEHAVHRQICEGAVEKFTLENEPDPDSANQPPRARPATTR